MEQKNPSLSSMEVDIKRKIEIARAELRLYESSDAAVLEAIKGTFYESRLDFCLRLLDLKAALKKTWLGKTVLWVIQKIKK